MVNGNSYIIAAFYTENTPYAVEIEHYLIKSLKRLSLPYYIEKVENRGSWLKNVAYKPQLALNALEKYPDKNIVLLDADSIVLQSPILFEQIPEEYDIALHILDWITWYQNSTPIKEYLSGTLFLRNNDKIKEIVKEWLSSATNSKLWEQKCLEMILKNKPQIKVFNLPIEYCAIESLPNGKKPHVKIENPIIVHYQASRKYKKLVNSNRQNSLR